jgi:hypothetical protein
MKGINYRIAVVFLLLFSSCRPAPPQDEVTGVNKVVDTFGGSCKYSTGVEFASDKQDIRYFELELSSTDLPDTLTRLGVEPSSGVALNFFGAIDPNNKGYQVVRVQLNSTAGRLEKQDFDFRSLSLVNGKLPVIYSLYRFIQGGNYQVIRTLMTADSPNNSDSTLRNMRYLDSVFGKPKKLQVFGFHITRNDGDRVLHVSCGMLRVNQNSPLGVDISLDKHENKILKFDYQF